MRLPMDHPLSEVHGWDTLQACYVCAVRCRHWASNKVPKRLLTVIGKWTACQLHTYCSCWGARQSLAFARRYTVPVYFFQLDDVWGDEFSPPHVHTTARYWSAFVQMLRVCGIPSAAHILHELITCRVLSVLAVTCRNLEFPVAWCVLLFHKE